MWKTVVRSSRGPKCAVQPPPRLHHITAADTISCKRNRTFSPSGISRPRIPSGIEQVMRGELKRGGSAPNVRCDLSI